MLTSLLNWLHCGWDSLLALCGRWLDTRYQRRVVREQRRLRREFGERYIQELADIKAVELDWEKRLVVSLKANDQPVQAEYVLQDGCRVDLLFDKYACEIDWAHKWAESIGQALYYALMTQRKPAIILLMDHGDRHFLRRCTKVAKAVYPFISIWTLDVRTAELDQDGRILKVK